MATVVTPQRFYASVATTTESTVYTVPAAQIDVITSMSFNNLTDVAHQVSVKLAGVFFAKNLDVPPRSLIALDFKQVINTTETITVQSDAADAISVFISGVKVNEV